MFYFFSLHPGVDWKVKPYICFFWRGGWGKVMSTIPNWIQLEGTTSHIRFITLRSYVINLSVFFGLLKLVISIIFWKVPILDHVLPDPNFKSELPELSWSRDTARLPRHLLQWFCWAPKALQPWGCWPHAFPICFISFIMFPGKSWIR